MHNSLGGLPKRTQTFLFFSIDPNGVKNFPAKLQKLLPLITTAKDVQASRDAIENSKKAAKDNNTTAPILPITGVNISFTKKGLTQVRGFYFVYSLPGTSPTDS